MKRAKADKSTKPARRSTALSGSDQARRNGVVVLEVLCGLRDAQDGARAMNVSANRYYQLETRALQGLIAALEPRPKGRRWSAEDKLAQVEKEKQRLEQEVGRLQALLRAAQRSMGIPPLPKRSKGGKLGGKSKAPGVRRRLRTVSRGLKRIEQLQKLASKSAPPTETKSSSSPKAAASP